MAFDTYLKLDGLDGESTREEASRNGSRSISFSLGASNPTTVGSGSGGMSAGKVIVSSFNVMKKTECASPIAVPEVLHRRPLRHSQVVTLNKASGDKGEPLAFLKFDFTEVLRRVDPVVRFDRRRRYADGERLVCVRQGRDHLHAAAERPARAAGKPRVAQYEIRYDRRGAYLIMNSRQLFDAGKLNAAIEALGAELRDNPTDAQRRTFLFELLVLCR